MDNYKDKLKQKMDQFVNEIFLATKNFPKEEIYITTAQIKRSALSIILNYIEGYARLKKGNQLNFMEISYGSLKETKYLLFFSLNQKFLDDKTYSNLVNKSDEIGAMLWTEIKLLGNSLDK